MRLHTRFRLMTTVSVVSAMVIACTFTLLIVNISRLIVQQKTTDEIAFLLINQNLFGQEYVERHSNRSSGQWWAAHNVINEILTQSKTVFPSAQKQMLIERMQNRLSIAAGLFRLIQNQQDALRTPSVVEREGILSRQLSLLATVLIVDANELSTLVRKDATSTQHTMVVLTVGAVFVLMFLALWRAVIIQNSVLLPIQELERATGQVASGTLHQDLEIHGDDEIGELASSFNSMNRTIRTSRESLLTMQRALETKVTERTAELTQKSIALEKSNRELTQFVYVASHDLQEPLRVMVNYLQLLEAAKESGDSSAADRYIDISVKQGMRMKELIHALLEYTAIESATTDLEPVNSGAALETALINLQTVITETGAEITKSAMPIVRADSRLLAQVFQNLISNALKYRSEQPPVINISARPEGPHWIFSVTDNGIGIDPVYHKKIFEMFQRLHGRTKYAGTGIGLSICQKIVEQLNGRIWVESTFGQGATFYFSLMAAVETRTGTLVGQS